MKLAEMTGNRLLQRYVGEVVSRCSLILALYGRPHSSECAVNEHREIIAALRAGDSEKAVAIMDRHVGSVEKRALIQERPEAPDIGEVLSRYSESLAAMDSDEVVPLVPAGRTRRKSR
jgi:DNA-binding GntR family transcriptional regulator